MPLLLPVNEKEADFNSTEPVDYPCSLQKEFDVACALTRSLLQRLLPAGAARPKGLDLQVVGVDRHLVFLDFRKHLNPGKGGMPSGRRTTYTYDALGNVLTTENPDGSSIVNTYNAHALKRLPTFCRGGNGLFKFLFQPTPVAEDAVIYFIPFIIICY